MLCANYLRGSPYAFAEKNMKTPQPTDSGIDILSKASLIKETWSHGDASSMIDDGFILIGVSPRPKDSEYPFYYSLIWPGPIESLSGMARERWLAY